MERAAGEPDPGRQPEVRAAAAPSRAFDGVVCFGGGDWWYHNRGHYDMQMMRELAREVPVLYVNSLGVRVPAASEGAMFVRRVRRKLRSLARGLVRVDEHFAVLSPFVVPGPRGMAATARLVPAQVRRAGRRIGIRRPLLWITCPPAAELVEATEPVGIVYQRTDRWESYPGADAGYVLRCHRFLRERADLTLFCATLLYEEEAARCRRAAYVDHGVDYEEFAAAGEGRRPEPVDVVGLPRPRAGFVGGIDSSTFDPALFVEVARRLPEVRFLCVGASSLPAHALDAPNVTLLGQRPYGEVARYMAACDVLLMPWNRSEWIRACNPVKLKEYLATGRPVVSTPFHELRRYEGLVEVAESAEGFAEAVARSLRSPPDPEVLRARVRDETWTRKARAVLDELGALGLAARSGPPERAAR